MTAPRSLAIVVSHAARVARALELAAAARGRGLEVGLFVMSEAVGAMPAARAAIAALAAEHVEVVACATSATALGLDEAAVGAPLGSQDDHAAIVARAARLIAFT